MFDYNKNKSIWLKYRFTDFALEVLDRVISLCSMFSVHKCRIKYKKAFERIPTLNIG